ncbi:hypothetical protein IMCC3317_07250 [Kordia antarctica]|uniref:Uncharacterized protein n=1 Tax=Kordia antarctica TaxID=1218801 RepID=A0A7L4ZFV5_9FLAO|nr:hypothetical protein [Kordia antarctica]QHI35379.1 hypothetical protein IMCC3317_07250 [Kordia antarctica]
MVELRFLSKYLVLATAFIGLFFYLVNYTKHKKRQFAETEYFLLSVFIMAGFDFLGSKFTSWFGILNYPVYNTYIITFMLFYYWWYFRLIKPKFKKNLLIAFGLLFLSFSLVNIFYIQSFYTGIQNFTYALGVIFLIISICFYFIEIFKSDMVLNITKSTHFWFSLGILLFHGTFLPFQVASEFFLLGDQKIFSTVLFFLNFVMCICFIIGFYTMKKNYNNQITDM